MGLMSGLTRLDDSVARRWPALFRTDQRRVYQTMILNQIVAVTALLVGAATGSPGVETFAICPVLMTLGQLVRLMPRRDDDPTD